MQDLLAEDEEENPQKTGYFLCVVVELKPTATHQERLVLIKADHKHLHLSLTAFNSQEVKPISNLWPVCFAGSRSKSPEDSMEVEGIDDWKMSRRNIARNYPWQAWSSEVDSQMWTRSCLCIYCPLVGARGYPVWHIDHTNSTTLFSEDPRANQNATNFHDISSLPMRRKSISLKPRMSVSESQSNHPPWQCCSHRWRPRSSRAPL